MLARNDFQTLRDAATLRQADAQDALIYVASDAAPLRFNRAAFGRLAGAYAAQFQTWGLGTGDLLIIAAQHPLTVAFSFWGAVLIGARPSIFPTLTEKLDPERYQASMAKLIALSGVKAVLTDPASADLLGSLTGCALHILPNWEDFIIKEGQFAPQSLPQGEGLLAFLQHSSGSTGLQKGVALTHEAVLNQLIAYAAALDLRPDDVIVSWLPLYHDMGLIAGFLLPLVAGIPLVLMSPFDWVAHPALLLQAIHDYRGTICWLPNFAYHHMARRIRPAQSEGLNLKSMRAFINCSEPVYAQSHQLFLERFAPNGLRAEQLAVCYALAENTFAASQTPLGEKARIDPIDGLTLSQSDYAQPIDVGQEGAREVVSCGYPIKGTQIKILDPKGQTLADRQVGEIALKSNYMLDSYYARPDLNADLLREGWYHTGDRGYMAEGELFVIGRAKDLIINAGKNVYPNDLEQIVNGVAGVKAGRVVAFGVYDQREGTELIAIVAETSAPAEDYAGIQRAIKGAIAAGSEVTAAYVRVVPVGWLIKTSSGKIARAANREKWQGEQV